MQGQILIRSLLVSGILLLSACASGPKPVEEFEIPVYPSPPEEPRFYYERSLISAQYQVYF